MRYLPPDLRTLPLLCLLGACGASESTSPEPIGSPATTSTEPAAPTEEPTPEAKGPTTQDYSDKAQALVQALGSDKEQEALIDQANALTEVGLGLVKTIIAYHPVWKEYLNAFEAIGQTLHDLPLEEIEDGYHKDGKLPIMPENPACYHGKDLVVHPATVAALVKKGLVTEADRAAAVAEITEVLSHLSVVTAPQ